MHILHVIKTLDPAAGGPPMIAARLAAGQSALGHYVSLSTTALKDREFDTQKALESIPDWREIKKYFFAPLSNFDWLLKRGSNSPLESLIREADVVHLHSVWDPMILASSWICRRLGKPYFILLNGTLDPWCLRQKSIKKKIALLLAYHSMINHAAALHLGNSEEQNLIQPLKLKAPRVIIPNGVFFEEIDPLLVQGQFRKSFPSIPDKPYFLFLSRLHYKKGLDLLADAFAHYVQKGGEFDLVVAGPDDGDGSLEDFQQRLVASDVQNRVHLIGPIYGSTKFHALADASAFVLPSRQEGFSVAITEALACGLPTVITEGCHFPEVAEFGAGYVTPFDATAYGEALLKIQADGRIKMMGTDARKLVEQRYTWHHVADQTVKAYREYANVP